MSHTDFLPAAPEVSVVIPVYNEEAGLPALFARLYPALDALGAPYEVIFINDGSRDRSAALLARAVPARPDVTRVILFNGNYGQHMAIMAGFEHVARRARRHARRRPAESARGNRQAARRRCDAGHDYVGSDPAHAPGQLVAHATRRGR